jgi:hypothetical protein
MRVAMFFVVAVAVCLNPIAAQQLPALRRPGHVGPQDVVADPDDPVASFKMPEFLSKDVRVSSAPHGELNSKLVERHKHAKAALAGRIQGWLLNRHSSLVLAASFRQALESGAALAPLGFDQQLHFDEMAKLALQIENVARKRFTIGGCTLSDIYCIRPLRWEATRIEAPSFDRADIAAGRRRSATVLAFLGFEDRRAVAIAFWELIPLGRGSLEETTLTAELHLNDVLDKALADAEQRRQEEKNPLQEIWWKLPKEFTTNSDPFAPILQRATTLEKHYASLEEAGKATLSEVLAATCHRLEVEIAIAKVAQKIDEVRKLRKQQLETFTRILEGHRWQFEHGRGNYEAMAAVHERASRCQLELAESRDQKENVLKTLVEIRAKQEFRAKDLLEAVRGPTTDLDAAKVARLSAEIHLLRL